MKVSGATKKDSSYLDSVCRIIETCAKSGVHELHLDDLSVFFTPDQQRTLYSRKGVKKPALSLVDTPPSIFPENSTEKRILKEEKDRLRQQIEDELELTDPETAERIAIKAAHDEIAQARNDKVALRRQITPTVPDPDAEEELH